MDTTNEKIDFSKISEIVDSFSDKYSGEFMTPEVIRVSWQTFANDYLGEDDTTDCDYHPEKMLWFSRLSASGYLDATDWTWDEDLQGLCDTILEMYPPID